MRALAIVVVVRAFRVIVVGRVLAACLAVLALAPAIANAGASAERELRLGSPPRLPAGAISVATVAGTTAMRITVVLKPRDQPALLRYARAVATPGSGLYRHYLRPAQFAAMFAPRAAVVGAVERSMRTHGLTPGSPSANGLSIPVTTTAGAVERAFSLSLAAVRMRDGASAVLNTSAPAVDVRLAGAIQAVIGLNSLAPAVPARVPDKRPGGAGAGLEHTDRSPRGGSGAPFPCQAATAAASADGAYTADKIASAYDFAPLFANGDAGRGVTIAVYELETYDPADIGTFQACYGTSASIGRVVVDGGPQPGTGPGSGEAALDLEQLIALAPAAHLVVYLGPNSNSDSPGSGPYDVLSKIVSQDVAQVVSNSWGQCEPMEGKQQAQAESVLLEEAAVQGQTVVSAAGDDGAQDCDQPGVSANSELAVDDPASQPFVTGVGGTSLVSVGPPPVETVWNSAQSAPSPLDIVAGAGGGGISTLWPMPAYQRDAPGALNVIQPGVSSGVPCGAQSGLCREVPDVSADADPGRGYMFYFNGSGTDPGSPSGWQPTGGTSGAAPVWAAVFALADASPECGGRSIGFANPALYRLAADSESTYFNDITSGGNDFTLTSGQLFSAGPGYDMASGLGSPKAAALAPALCKQTLTLATPTAQRSFEGDSSSLRLVASDIPGSVLSFEASGLPRGLALDRHSGVISGRALRSGSSKVTVTVADSSGAQRRASFRWTVEGRPVVRARLSGLAAGTPELVLRLTAGADEPGLETLSVQLPRGLWLAGHGNLGLTARSGGRSVRYRALRRGATVTVRLLAPSRRLSLGFAAPLLHASGVLSRPGASERLKLRLLLAITDAALAQTTLRIPLSS
jgi:subtilase family serine protease